MIEAVTNEVEFGKDGWSRKRSVSSDDAAVMVGDPGKWFKVHRVGGRYSGPPLASRLRKLMPAWYGGEWEVCTKAGEVYVRSVPVS